MEIFTLSKPWLATQIAQYTYELEAGLIVIGGSEQNWVNFMLLGLLGSYQNNNFNIVNKNDSKDYYYFKHLDNNLILDTNKELHYYGAVRDIEKLEAVLESAKERLTIIAMHVNPAEAVSLRIKDMLTDNGKDFESHINLLKCVISYDAND